MAFMPVHAFTATDKPGDQNASQAEQAQWVLNPPNPPSHWLEFIGLLREFVFPRGNKFSSFCKDPGLKQGGSLLGDIFSIVHVFRNYKATKFKNDFMAGLTLASLCIPQSIGYATLAKLDPQYGLYTSVVPPLIYAMMGTSRELAIGPVAIVSLLLSSMLQNIIDPHEDPIAYRNLVFTATFFAGIFQTAFGLFRLGFLVDFLSHAAIVGFMGGAAIVIGLQQLKGLLGITHFTNKTDIVSVIKALCRSTHHHWNPNNFFIGCSFLSFILITKFLGKKKKKLFWLPAIAPLISVTLSTLFVYLTKADENGVNIIKHISGGLNPISLHELQLINNPHLGHVAKIGLIAAIVALTEAIAVGRSFASVKGYQLNGNKEMLAMGIMNTVGSLTSCYVATGSFSRSAVNFSAGCETVVSNIIMSITVLIALQFFTKFLYYTPTAILASIILSALPNLIDLNEIYEIWKVDKLDFLACIGAFFGVLFASVEIGLIIAIFISFLKIVVISIQPSIEIVGRLPGTNMFCDVHQYTMAVEIPGVLVVRLKSAFLCFANASLVTQRIMRPVMEEKGEHNESKGNEGGKIQLIVLDMSNLMSIDTSGIASLDELNKKLISLGTEFAIVNPRWKVIHKMRLAKLLSKMEGRVFLNVEEAMNACLSNKLANV